MGASCGLARKACVVVSQSSATQSDPDSSRGVVRPFSIHCFRFRALARTLAEFNARIAAVTHKRQLCLQKGNVSWHWNTSAQDPDAVLGPILLSAAELLVAGQYPKVRQCEGESCGWVFLDRSQAGRRRWRSMADCGNRAKVRNFYLQQRKASAAKRLRRSRQSSDGFPVENSQTIQLFKCTRPCLALRLKWRPITFLTFDPERLRTSNAHLYPSRHSR